MPSSDLQSGQDQIPAVVGAGNHLRFLTAVPEAVRKVSRGGTEYLVVPVVALCEGVFQCATCPTPELYEAAEFAKIPTSWNGRPVTIGHPKQNGFYVSAGSLDVWEQDGIGTIQNARLDGTKLKVEAWIDLFKVDEIGGEAAEAVRRLEAGDQVEVSVGAFVDSIPRLGALNGEPFGAVQQNYVPDHLAILPATEIGACSWQDGCGAPRLNVACACGGGDQCQCGQGGQMLQSQTTGGSPDPLRQALTFTAAQLGDGAKREILTTALQQKESGFFFIIEVFEDHVVYHKEGGQTLKRDFSIDESDGTVTLSDDVVAGALVAEFMPITVQEDTMQRNEIIDRLIANAASPWADTDRAFLTGLDDAQFAKIAPNEADAAGDDGAGDQPAANADPAATPAANADGGDPQPAAQPTARQPLHLSVPAQPAQPMTAAQYVAAAPPEIQEILGEGMVERQQQRVSLIGQLTANQGCPFTQEQLAAKTTQELRQLVALAGMAAPAQQQAVGDYRGAAPTSINAPADMFAALPAEPDWGQRAN